MTSVQQPDCGLYLTASQQVSSAVTSITSHRSGCKLLDGSKAYYRFSDIMFEWHKKLNPYQANAVKSLLNFEALVEPTHPLRQEVGDDEGVVFYVAICRDGKPRAFMTFKQVEYLVYWIDKMQLVEGRVPIPNSKSLLFENDLGDIIPLVISDPALIKRALNRPNQSYAQRKQAASAAERAATEQDHAEDEAEAEQDVTANRTHVESEAVHHDVAVEGSAGDPGNLEEEHDPTANLDIAQTNCLAAYHRAQQLLIVASSPEDLPLPADMQADNDQGGSAGGRINFISIHFNSLGLDSVYEVGWAKTFWDGEGEEVRDQGHWIVPGYKDLAELLPAYFFSESEVMSELEIRQELSKMIDQSTYMIVHSNLKEFDAYSIVDIPVVPDAHVIDTVQMVQALSSTWADATLQDVAKQMLAGSGQPVTGFGNSGNDAWWHMETFLTMIGPQYDLAKQLLLEEPQSDNEDEVEFQKKFHGIGFDDVEFNLDEFDYDIGPGGPEDEEDFM